MGPTQQTFPLFVIKLFVFIITHNMNEDEGGRKGRGFAAGCVEGLYKRVQRVQKVQRVVDCRCAAIIIKPPTAAVVGALRKW